VKLHKPNVKYLFKYATLYMNSNIWPAQPRVMLCVTQHTFNSIDSVRVTNDRVMLDGKLIGTFSVGFSVKVTDI